MNLPNVITDLVKAQNDFDSTAYIQCFAETAEVIDEGKTYKGKQEIKKWIEYANEHHRPLMNPIEYSIEGQALEAKVSGTFPGSPIVLTYYFDVKEDKIQSLKII